jgi:putative flippase GtrA
MTALIRGEALRFVIAGAINTAVTYAIYLALLPWSGYAVAYTIAYVTGIALSYVLSTWYVFRVRRDLRGLALFPLVYLAQYLIGMLVLSLSVSSFGVPEKFALLISIAITVPMTFVLSRLFLKRGSAPTQTMDKAHE